MYSSHRPLRLDDMCILNSAILELFRQSLERHSKIHKYIEPTAVRVDTIGDGQICK